MAYTPSREVLERVQKKARERRAAQRKLRAPVKQKNKDIGRIREVGK